MQTRFRVLLCFGAALATLTSTFAAPFSVEKTGAGLVDPSALTIGGVYGPSINGQSFQHDALITFQGWQYLGYYDGARHVCLARRQLPAGAWEIIRFTDYTFKEDDAHNTISLGIAPGDGTIHLAFDHHGSDLHYRVSSKKTATHPDSIRWNDELFSPVTNQLDKPTRLVTYPSFVSTPQGNLQLFYRFGTSGAGQWWMADYDASSGAWKNTHQIDSGDGVFQDSFNTSKNRNAYPNGFDYGPDGRLHYTWTWRENTQGANHDICYAYSDDQGASWRNNAGAVVNPGNGSQVITIDTPGITAVPIDRSWSLMNQQTQAVDSKGRIHVAMWRRKDGSRFENQTWTPNHARYYHYWRNDQGEWQKAEIPSAVGNRPKLLFDAANNAYLIYTVNRDPSNWLNGIYYLDGELLIAAASAASNWTDWSVIHREQTGAYLNELLGDSPRFLADGTLSVLVQETPRQRRDPSTLRVLDFKITGPARP